MPVVTRLGLTALSEPTVNMPSALGSARVYEPPSKVAQILAIDAEAGEPTDVKQAAAAKPRWERLPSGTPLRVWWEGNDDYYECKILDWRVGYNDAKELVYTHRCQ